MASEPVISLIRQLKPSEVSHNDISKVAEQRPGGRHITRAEPLTCRFPPILPSLACTHILVAFAKPEGEITATAWKVSFPGKTGAEVTQLSGESLWMVTSSTSPVVSSMGCGICQQLQRSLDNPVCEMKPLLRVLTVLTNLWGSLCTAAPATLWASPGDAKAH